ncbi:MAG: gamma-glutamyltransferase family protein [Acetobacteraceae bacterium]
MRDFHLPGRSVAFATHGMAATSMPAASLTALGILRAGGNALDAAVAAMAVLTVIEPQSTGIGGDCFCLYAPAGTGRVVALNGSGRAPAAADLSWYDARGLSSLEHDSAHSVTVPGAISAWQTLLAAHGTRGLDELLQPAIRFAEEGFVVHPRVAFDWRLVEEKLRKNGAAAFLPRGRAPAAGERFTPTGLAATLRAIAKQGARAFYEGPVAADMVAALRAHGGLHTEADFAAGLEGAAFVTPIRSSWRGYEVWQCPPNGTGILVLMQLGILGGMASAAGGPTGALRLHRHAEAARLVQRDRDAFVADPALAAVPVARLLDEAYLSGLRDLIDDDHMRHALPPAGQVAIPEVAMPEVAAPAHADTAYLAVVDRDGNAASFINSLFQSFGSGILAEKSGVMLQNRGFSFNLVRGHPNAIAGGKRPMHTIIPGMVTKEGQTVMPFGVMGGHFQPMGQTLFLTNFLEYGLDIQEALDAPRVFPASGTLEIERGLPLSTLAGLEARGWPLTVVDRPLGGGQAIWIDREKGVLSGGSDPRKDGLALGY